MKTNTLINTAGIIWLALFVCSSFILLLYKNSNRKKLNKEIYSLSFINHFAKLLFPINYLLMSILFLPLGFLAANMLFKNYFLVGIMGVVIIICAILLSYISIVVFKLHRKYYMIEKGRIIEVDQLNKQIKFINSNKNISILSNDEIKSIENHFSSSNARNPISEYEFIKYINLSGNIFFITSLQADINVFTKIFDKGKTKNIYTQVNDIK